MRSQEITFRRYAKRTVTHQDNYVITCRRDGAVEHVHGVAEIEAEVDARGVAERSWHPRHLSARAQCLLCCICCEYTNLQLDFTSAIMASSSSARSLVGACKRLKVRYSCTGYIAQKLTLPTAFTHCAINEAEPPRLLIIAAISDSIYAAADSTIASPKPRTRVSDTATAQSRAGNISQSTTTGAPTWHNLSRPATPIVQRTQSRAVRRFCNESRILPQLACQRTQTTPENNRAMDGTPVKLRAQKVAGKLRENHDEAYNKNLGWSSRHGLHLACFPAETPILRSGTESRCLGARRFRDCEGAGCRSGENLEDDGGGRGNFRTVCAS